MKFNSILFSVHLTKNLWLGLKRRSDFRYIYFFFFTSSLFCRCRRRCVLFVVCMVFFTLRSYRELLLVHHVVRQKLFVSSLLYIFHSVRSLVLRVWASVSVSEPSNMWTFCTYVWMRESGCLYAYKYIYFKACKRYCIKMFGKAVASCVFFFHLLRFGSMCNVCAVCKIHSYTYHFFSYSSMLDSPSLLTVYCVFFRFVSFFFSFKEQIFFDVIRLCERVSFSSIHQTILLWFIFFMYRRREIHKNVPACM